MLSPSTSSPSRSGGEVEGDVVAGGDRAVGVDERGVAALLGLVRLGEVVVGDLDRRELDLQVGVPLDGDGRADLARGVELDRAGLLALGDLDLRRGDQVDVVLANGTGEVLRDGVTQCLLTGGAEADAGFQHLARDLAGTEPRQADLLRDRLECPIDVVFELVFFDFDVQLDLVALEGFQRTLHRSASVSAARSVPDTRGAAWSRRDHGRTRRAARPGRMAADGVLDAAQARLPAQGSARPQDRRPRQEHRRHPRRSGRHRGQGHPGQRLQLAALPRAVRRTAWRSAISITATSNRSARPPSGSPSSSSGRAGARARPRAAPASRLHHDGHRVGGGRLGVHGHGARPRGPDILRARPPLRPRRDRGTRTRVVHPVPRGTRRRLRLADRRFAVSRQHDPHTRR